MIIAAASLTACLQGFDVLLAQERAGFRVGFGLFVPGKQADGGDIPAETMEIGPPEIALGKKFLGGVQDGGQIPGDEIQIAVVGSHRVPYKGEGVRAGMLVQRFLQCIPDIKNCWIRSAPRTAYSGQQKNPAPIPSR